MDNNSQESTRQEELNALVEEEFMLTTLDNPYNPFTNWREWFAFDTQKGYNTCNYLARIVKTSDELSEIDQALAIDRAMDEIIELNLLGIYIKVSRKSFMDRSGTTTFPTVEIRME